MAPPATLVRTTIGTPGRRPTPMLAPDQPAHPIRRSAIETASACASLDGSGHPVLLERKNAVWRVRRKVNTTTA